MNEKTEDLLKGLRDHALRHARDAAKHADVDAATEFFDLAERAEYWLAELPVK